MHNLVPAFIQDQYRRGKIRGSFSAVGMFIDISGFSKLTDALMTHGSHGAEVMARVMVDIFTPMAENIFAHGGYIIGLAGDGLTAVYPVEADIRLVCEHALAAGWQIQQEIKINGLHETDYGDFTIQAKIGLAAGEARWGIILSSDSRRASYYFLGQAVEGAANAEHQAQAGEILVDHQVLSAIHDLVKSEPSTEYSRIIAPIGSFPDGNRVEPPPSDPEIQALFYPGVAFDQEQADEFRQIVSLFINLPTVRSEDQLAAFMQTVFNLQDQYGGLCSKPDFGDKGSNLLVLWGMPATFENDIERALNFVLGLQALTSIPVNAGLTYQIAHAGFIGSPYFEDFTGYGRGINLAARFMTSTPRSEIWVGESIARRMQTLFEFDDLGLKSFKGFSEPQPVYALVDRKAQAEPFFTGEMIGRRGELERLAAFFLPLCEGKPVGVMVILGEAGMGKSRLVYEFQRTAACLEHKPLWAMCQVDEILREPLNPFRYWLNDYFQQSNIQPEARNKRNFNRVIDDLISRISPIDRRLSEEVDRLRSFLGAIVGLHWADSLHEELDAQGRFDNTLAALTVLFQAESLYQPVVLLLEDIQWLDLASRQFIQVLLSSITIEPDRDFPLGIIATARPEHAETFGGGFNLQTIELSRLSGLEMVELVRNNASEPPGEELTRLLDERADGNPFYAEQILRYLQEEGRLKHESGTCDLIAGPDQKPLPEDVRAILVARLDRLDIQVRNVVQTASVLGREFEIQILSAMLRNPKGLKERVEAAHSAAIWKPMDELNYMFQHVLMQDAAYGMMLQARRKALHSLAVETIESLFQDDLHHHFAQLAYHSEQAGLLEKTRNYLESAGNEAQNNYQNQQAVDYYTRALTMTPAGDLETRYRLIKAQIKSLFLLGEFEAQQKELDELTRLAELLAELPGRRDAIPYRSEVLGEKAAYAYQIGNFSQAVEWAKSAVELALTVDHFPVALDAYLSWAMALDRQGQFDEAIQIAGKANELAERLHDRLKQSDALNVLGLVTWSKNDLDSAFLYLGNGLKIAEELRARRIISMSLNNLANLEAARGDYAAALDYYTEALQITREIGERAKQGITLGNLGWLNGMLGDYATARAYVEQSLRILRLVGDPWGEIYALINLSAFSGRQAEYQVAFEYAENARKQAELINDPSAQAWALTYIGHALHGLGDSEQARDAYGRSAEIRRRLEQPSLECEPLAGIARLAFEQGDLESAAQIVSSILAYLDEGGSLDGLDEPMRVYLTCYSVLQAINDRRAGTILETAHQRLIEQAEKISDGQLRQSFLDNVPFHRELRLAWEENRRA